jgi:hypothetical protein
MDSAHLIPYSSYYRTSPAVLRHFRHHRRDGQKSHSLVSCEQQMVTGQNLSTYSFLNPSIFAFYRPRDTSKATKIPIFPSVLPNGPDKNRRITIPSSILRPQTIRQSSCLSNPPLRLSTFSTKGTTPISMADRFWQTETPTTGRATPSTGGLPVEFISRMRIPFQMEDISIPSRRPGDAEMDTLATASVPGTRARALVCALIWEGVGSKTAGADIPLAGDTLLECLLDI